MTNHNLQVATRLKGLRDALDLTPQQMAVTCGMSEAAYLEYESGDKDISVSMLHIIAQQYGVELPALLFGDEPKMTSYFVTRAGKGASIERTKSYKYQSLAAGFAGRKADPFMVTVEPKDDDVPFTMNTHAGQEFDYIIEGNMQIKIGDKILELFEGDSVMYDSSRPHGMKAMGNKPVKFLAIIF